MVISTEIGDDDFRELLEAEVPTLGNYQVAFALPQEGPFDARLGGSGTLVSIGDTEGILTAKHVLCSLRRAQAVGLILPSQSRELHHVPVDMKLCSEFVWPITGEPQPSGPDLAMLIPPHDLLGTLRAKKSFYNLTKRQREVLDNPRPIDRGFWVLSGNAAEWTSDAPKHRGFERIKVFRGGIGAGEVTSEYEEEGFDYLIFEALYNDLYEGPQSFGGFSGGGLWQLLVRCEDGKVRVIDRILSGVAFFQSDLTKRSDETIRAIRCHGRKSVYGVLVNRVRSQETD